jgi:hypothetical protein
MKKRIRIFFLTMAIMTVMMINTAMPAFASNDDTLSSNTINKSATSEVLTMVIAMSENYDVNEPIYIALGGIRTAKATYVKPVKLKIDILSKQSGIAEFVIATRNGAYDEDGNWVMNVGGEIYKLNDYIYYTKFDAFKYEATLTARVEMDWLTPWHETITSTSEKIFNVGYWFNVTSVVNTAKSNIENSVLSGINVGVDFAVKLIEQVDIDLGLLSSQLDSIKSLLVSSETDPANLNFYVIDLVGNTTYPGPMFEVVRDDLYSHLGSETDRNNSMDARHAFIITSIMQSLDVLNKKVGTDTDASDGKYSYTVTFVQKL